MTQGPFPCDELIDGPQERSKSFSTTRRGGDQYMFTGSDWSPCPILEFRRNADFAFEPLADQRVKERETCAHGLILVPVHGDDK